MKFNIIGAGCLGKTLAQSLLTIEHHQLLAICNRQLSSAQAAVHVLKTGQAVSKPADLPTAEITFITTPDEQIELVALDLANNGFILPGQIIVHCSGAFSSSLLTPLKEKGCFIASLHPLRAFRAHHVENSAFFNCHCVIEGDEFAVNALKKIFADLGAKLISLDAQHKSNYHAAAVMASNYLVTLANSSIDLFKTAGISESYARDITFSLMHSSLNNLQHTEHPSAALTGPLSRGDVETIKQHLNAITKPYVKKLYKTAGLATLPLVNIKKTALLALKELLR